jgi:hypothetical protein
MQGTYNVEEGQDKEKVVKDPVNALARESPER